MAEHDGHGLALVELLDRLSGGGSDHEPRSSGEQAEHQEQAAHVHSPMMPRKQIADPRNAVYLNSQSVIPIPQRVVQPKDFFYRPALRSYQGKSECVHRSLTDTSAPAAATSPR